MQLEEKGARLENELHQILKHKNILHHINRIGSMMSVFFTNEPVTNFETASTTDINFFNKFFHHLLNHEIYLPPSAYESWFISNALSSEDIETMLGALESFTP